MVITLSELRKVVSVCTAYSDYAVVSFNDKFNGGIYEDPISATVIDFDDVYSDIEIEFWNPDTFFKE